MHYISNDGALWCDVAGNNIYPEEDTRGLKVLLINTRNYESDIVEEAKQSSVDHTNFFLQIMLKNEDLMKPGVPPFDVMQVPELKLSADHGPSDWISLAQVIQKNYLKYRGFVVQSGTDNMVASSTALSFALEGLGKPVIFTGSLIPGNRIYTDMKRNIILALGFASCSQISEVCILFDEILYRANRAIRVSLSNLRPFSSPHYPPLGMMQGGVMVVRQSILLSHPRGRLRVACNMATKILTLQLGPGIPFEVLMRAVETTESRAVILICFGSGNAPSRNGVMRRLLALASARDMVVVICTQNRYGIVNLAEYETGRQLMEAGAISAGDMTQEATLMKLKYLYGIGLSSNEVRRYFSVDVRGETTLPSAKL